MLFRSFVVVIDDDEDNWALPMIGRIISNFDERGVNLDIVCNEL